MGLASWAGPGSSDGAVFERLVRAFDELDGSEAFVHPDRMAAVAASDKRAERAALDEITDAIADAVRRFDGGDTPNQTLFGTIVQAWSSESRQPRERLEHPAQLERVLLEGNAFAQSCALESTRMAQRSIMARTVLSPVLLDTGETVYRVPPGWTIATLLPLLNMSAVPGLQRWDPDRRSRHRLTDQDALPSPMLVTAFGHGRHSCPAQPFSLAAMTAAMTRLLSEYRMTPRWTSHPRPVPAQIGGIARAAGPCRVDYAKSS
jgi:hypothetical protein